MSQSIEKLTNRLFSPIDISILVYFRIIFGAIMLYEVFRYFANDWIYRYYIEPDFNFTYYGFDWVKPWPGDLMYLHFAALGILSIFIMLGFKYRISMILFFLAFSYTFLLEEANYLNHFYFIMWVSFIMIFVPAHRAFSIDAWRNKKLHTDTVSAWPLWFLRAMVGIVYFFGGVAKLNADWLAGEPMRTFLYNKSHWDFVGQFFTEEWLVYSAAYGALLVDLLIVPFLLWKKTRIPAFVIAVIFHVSNAYLFSIGIFPWFMIFATLIFFDPSWPRKLVNYIQKTQLEKKSRNKKSKLEKKFENLSVSTNETTKKIIVIIFISFLVLQTTIPLRHYFYPGDVSWTEEGHMFSWMMKLRVKEPVVVSFVAVDRSSDQAWLIVLDDLTKKQTSKVYYYPDVALQYAHHVADQYRELGYEDVEVYADIKVGLNGREPQDLIDTKVNLAEQPRTLLHKTWIVPLED